MLSEGVAAILLAAGASRRMGTNKMLLTLSGEALARRAVRRALDAGFSPVVVVVGNDAALVHQELAGLSCEFALNPDFAGPTSGSLHRGLAQLPANTDAAVVMLADMVQVTSSMLRMLLDTAGGTHAPLIVSRYGDVLAPPLLFRRALFPELLAWHGEGCGKQVVQQHRAEAVFLDWPLEALSDVDTPEDFERARASEGRR